MIPLSYLGFILKRKTLITILSIAVVATVVIGVFLWNFIQQIEKTVVGYVAIVRLSGTISYSSGLFGGAAVTPSDFKYYVDRIVSDPAAKAVVFVINSPGGSAAASEEMYQLMEKLAESKIVVVYASETLASGGYYISLPAHRIIASPHALVGSIGAIMMVYNINELLDKLGINVTIIKSGEFKDIGSAIRAPSNEEIGLLKDIIDKTAKIFIDRVKKHRVVDNDVFTAKIYIGIDAIDVGLVDGIGTLDDAIKIARELANMPHYAPVVEIEKPAGLLELLFGRGSQLNKIIDIPGNMMPNEFANKILYLWMPGS
uniref:Signal peptide peptidase SppA n=1 Tax=Ignisphaera aggregans TaxID=334771 RepID=A0A7J3JQM7_9CREN